MSWWVQKAGGRASGFGRGSVAMDSMHPMHPCPEGQIVCQGRILPRDCCPSLGAGKV